MSNLSEMDAKDILRYKNTLAAIAIIVIFGLIAKNIVSTHKQNMSVLEKEKEKIKEHRELVSKHQTLKAKYSNLIQKYFQGNEIDLKSYLERVANGYGLQISSVRPSQKSEEFYKINELAINLEGTYHNFVQFLNDLEKQNMEVKRVSMKQKNHNIDVQITVLAISLK
jgi:Tfp pilus assembly protein PilO